MKKAYFLLFLLLLINGVLASNYTFEIEKKEIFVNINVESSQYIHLPFRPEGLEIEGEYLLQETELYFFSSGEVNYTTAEYLEKSGQTHLFILKDEYLVNSSVKVLLPKGSVLSEKYFVHPEGYFLTTNGKNIILYWEKFPSKEILISYEEKQNGSFLWLTPFFLIFAIIIWFMYFRKEKKNYSKNLYKEEKEIVNYLLKKKDHSCWTKEISRDLNISKVRLSRKIRNLVEKGIVQKEPYGNENKIILKK